jgi:hypothetical protein
MTRIRTTASSGSKWAGTCNLQASTDEWRLTEQARVASKGREDHTERAAYFLAHRKDALGADALASLMACSRDGVERHHWHRAFVAVQQRIGATDGQ